MIPTSSYSAAPADTTRANSFAVDRPMRRPGARLARIRRAVLSTIGLGLAALLFVALISTIEAARQELASDAARSAATSLSSEPR